MKYETSLRALFLEKRRPILKKGTNLADFELTKTSTGLDYKSNTIQEN